MRIFILLFLACLTGCTSLRPFSHPSETPQSQVASATTPASSATKLHQPGSRNTDHDTQVPMALKPIIKQANRGNLEAQLQLAQYYSQSKASTAQQQANHWYEQAAQQGSAQAQYMLGYRYRLGLGVKQDYQQAVKWFTLAAEQGHADAQDSLGVRYAKGQGVEQDPQKAFYWFQKAAQQGNLYAENELGFLYSTGKGIPQDYRLAHHWYEKAATKGLASAQFNLGKLYDQGLGVNKDPSIALSWFNKAAQQGFPAAKAYIEKYAKGKF